MEKITLGTILELIIGLAVFLVIFGIVYQPITSFFHKQSDQELILDKIEAKLPFIEKGTCRTVLFDIDEFNFVVLTPDQAHISCAKDSPCACVSFPKESKITCKNYPALKNKCDNEGLCYEEKPELKVVNRVLKLCADEQGQLKYGGS